MSKIDDLIKKYTVTLRDIPNHQIVEMAAVTVSAEWKLEFLTVRTGGAPRRVNLVNVKTKKKYLIPFNNKDFDFSTLSRVPSEIVNKVKKILLVPGVVQTLYNFWTDGNEKHLQSVLRIG